MPSQTDADIESILAGLRQHASAKLRADLAPRYGIVTADEVLGVPMAATQKIAKAYAPDHALALKLWETGIYEARMAACMIDDAALVTAKQMDRWCRDFDNWAVTDTACFKLFDRVPGASSRIAPWAARNDEFGRRAAFALLACLALHKRGTDADFTVGLALIERYASDDRNFVKKGVSWALRAIGCKTSPAMRKSARDLATRLARSTDKTERWIGKDAIRDFAKSTSSSFKNSSPRD